MRPTLLLHELGIIYP